MKFSDPLPCQYNSFQNVTISFLSFLLVCLDVQLNVVGKTQNESTTILENISTARWILGSCSSLNSIDYGAKYQYPALYTERCCLAPGIHTLVCYNDPPARGWKDSYILINGHRYCDDFLGFKSFQKIIATGANFKFMFEMRCITYYIIL